MQIASLLVAVTTLILTFLRLRMGFDFHDETYYVVVAYRQALGDVPFVDDLNLTQGFGLIAGPFAKLHLLLTGSSDGLVLHMRRVFLFMNGIGCAAVFWAARRAVAWPVALLVASACLAFIPLNLPTPSYNSLGATFFAAGAFVAWGAVLDSRA
jgi:hypothetical protein